ncbi:MAG: DUF1236 domain-containing protein [Pseudolabrys sp.]
MRKTQAIAAAVLVAAASAAANAQGTNGERTDQQKGESSYIQGTQSSLGQNGISRTGDIRRTATGKLQFTPQQVAQIRDAVGRAKLKREDHVAFTIAVGATVPKQADARDLPRNVAKAVPSSTPMRYVLARDQLVLIDKRTQRIVAIIPGMG